MTTRGRHTTAKHPLHVHLQLSTWAWITQNACQYQCEQGLMTVEHMNWGLTFDLQLCVFRTWTVM